MRKQYYHSAAMRAAGVKTQIAGGLYKRRFLPPLDCLQAGEVAPYPSEMYDADDSDADARFDKLKELDHSQADYWPDYY